MRQRVTDLTTLAGSGGVGARADSTQSRALTARGRVARAPASESDPMEVVVTTLTQTYSVTVPAGNWAPRGTTLPVVGNECLVKYDDLGDAWVGSDWNPF